MLDTGLKIDLPKSLVIILIIFLLKNSDAFSLSKDIIESQASYPVIIIKIYYLVTKTYFS